MFGRNRASTLGPPPQGHGDFWASVHVRFSAPLATLNDPTRNPIHGYYRNLGIRALPDRVRLAIAEVVDDGAIDWDDTEWNLVNPTELDRDVRSRIEPVAGAGIWYKSGRILYSDDDTERR